MEGRQSTDSIVKSSEWKVRVIINQFTKLLVQFLLNHIVIIEITYNMIKLITRQCQFEQIFIILSIVSGIISYSIGLTNSKRVNLKCWPNFWPRKESISQGVRRVECDARDYGIQWGPLESWVLLTIVLAAAFFPWRLGAARASLRSVDRNWLPHLKNMQRYSTSI